MIKWATNREDMKVESQIAQRAVTMARELGIEYDQMAAIMDVDACHNNGNPLKLQELLDADDFNFAHDVFGIRTNINRTTGKLENCFLPRYSS